MGIVDGGGVDDAEGSAGGNGPGILIITIEEELLTQRTQRNTKEKEKQETKKQKKEKRY
jgi:hypothetical protein